MKQINVCYKHSDLLRQARERCILSRDGAAPINTAEPAAVQDKEIKKKTTSNTGNNSSHSLIVSS